jgi:3-oxoacyl-[acyl-carrier-protein] synthase II
MALASPGIGPSDVDYVNAHGTSTPLNDVTETRAIKAALGESAYDVAISSTKSVTGHLLGAAGAVEAIVCVKAIENNLVPPTMNLDEPEPECDLDYVPNVARQMPVDVVLSNSFGFGGHNACLVFRRVS